MRETRDGVVARLYLAHPPQLKIILLLSSKRAIVANMKCNQVVLRKITIFPNENTTGMNFRNNRTWNWRDDRTLLQHRLIRRFTVY